MQPGHGVPSLLTRIPELRVVLATCPPDGEEGGPAPQSPGQSGRRRDGGRDLGRASRTEPNRLSHMP